MRQRGAGQGVQFEEAGLRSTSRKIIDLLTFPARAVSLFEKDRFGLSSLRSERFDYVAREVQGYCLDVGCGRHNEFVRRYLKGHGRGIDVYPYEGLGKEDLVEDISQFPFPDSSFDTVTFIANLNHVPAHLRDVELSEAHRVLRPGGKIIVTMGNPLAEILVHKLVAFYDRVLGTKFDVDGERGMEEGEQYYLTDWEIQDRLSRAGFGSIRKKYFWTQWGLNHMLIGHKPPEEELQSFPS